LTLPSESLPPFIEPGDLSRRVAGFVRHLRGHGFGVGHADLLTILSLLNTSLRPLHEVRKRLKILLCQSKAEWDLFDDVFNRYWQADVMHYNNRLLEKSQPIAVEEHHAWQPHLAEDDDDELTDEDGSSMATNEGVALAGEARSRLIASDVYLRNRVDLRDVVDPDEMRVMERRARLSSFSPLPNTGTRSPTRSSQNHSPQPKPRW